MLWHLVCVFALCIRKGFSAALQFWPEETRVTSSLSSTHMEVMCNVLVNMKLTCFVKTAHVKSHVTRDPRHGQIWKCWPQGF